MFTGIIEAVGRIADIENHGDDIRLSIEGGKLDLSDLKTGDSISVNGVCLSVVELYNNIFKVDVSKETLVCTTLNELSGGSSVNLEKSLRLSDRLHGHIVSGHVDAVGRIMNRATDGRSEQFEISVPDGLMKFICKKGSVCVDGASLTVNNTDMDKSSFQVNIIPHTLQETIFSEYRPGTGVNIEIDVIARYLESLYQVFR